MTPEQRRETIVSAALPLVAERGAAVTTAQIARAAGIGEATIFRVFDDKDALLQACILRALDPANVLSQLHSISLDQPLADRLVEALEALDAHGARIGAVIGALHASGMPHRRPRPGDDALPHRRSGTGDGDGDRGGDLSALSASRDESQAATRRAVLDLIEPDRETLRLPAEAVTDAFLGIITGRGRGPQLPAAELVDLFLYGALARP
ncbi:regulatory protein, tetR family [Paractinoplanes atraurantiacus]|uniref:Regulatory protein, tetR family n=2 Tax=Paractinoplanes atraurantiacus TaxID=1036182 RepID=A0A285H4P5_9ACTN|nr:regulatory protein, tetR family [Actinoplanes atraurantiacus]